MSKILESIIRLKTAFHKELQTDLVDEIVGVELRPQTWSRLNHWYQLNRQSDPYLPVDLKIEEGVLEAISICGVHFRPTGFWGRTVSRQNGKIFDLQKEVQEKSEEIRHLEKAVLSLSDAIFQDMHYEFRACSAHEALKENQEIIEKLQEKKAVYSVRVNTGQGG